MFYLSLHNSIAVTDKLAVFFLSLLPLGLRKTTFNFFIYGYADNKYQGYLQSFKKKHNECCLLFKEGVFSILDMHLELIQCFRFVFFFIYENLILKSKFTESLYDEH